MQHWSVAALLLLITAADLSGAVRSSIRSYRASTYRSMYSSDTYRGPVYTRRLSPSVMGALYFSYASRYPNYFSYRRAAVMGGSACLNNLALDNGSYIGNFSCPFLPDEPGNWTRCCGYEVEGFCCDPSYDDSWKFGRLTGLVIGLIVASCLVGVCVLGWAAVAVVRKRGLLTHGATGAGNGSADASAMKQQLIATPGYPQQQPPYPTSAFEPRQGEVQPSAPLYPPSNYGTHNR